jgi:8-oxo-dGTP pyrophosphatase MutT (NUDIX family)
MNLDPVADHDPDRVEGTDRQAAVLVPIVERPTGPHIVFIKRSDYGDHAGQMAFPGGGSEPEDEDLLDTALREAHEEVGIGPETVEVVGRLDDIETVTGYAVTPFVGRVPDTEFVPHEHEVAEIAVLPLAELTDLDNYESERRDHPYYGTMRVHYFRVGGYTVWGATGRILVQFLELATDWEEPAEPDRVVGPDADFSV